MDAKGLAEYLKDSVQEALFDKALERSNEGEPYSPEDDDDLVYSMIEETIEGDEELEQYVGDDDFISDVHDKLTDLIDFEDINEGVSDVVYINKYGMLAYCGMSYSDFM